VKKDELPKSYADLANPRWKGRLGIEADDQDWLAGVLAQMGEQKGIQVFRDVVRTNGISVRRGHTLLTNLVASGEVPLALTVYNYKAEQLKNQGAPIDWFVIGKAPARANGVGVAAPRASSARSGPVLRFRDRRGGPAHPRQARLRADQPQHRHAAQQDAARAGRSEGDARPAR
jgi:hypothetical protein